MLEVPYGCHLRLLRSKILCGGRKAFHNTGETGVRSLGALNGRFCKENAKLTPLSDVVIYL